MKAAAEIQPEDQKPEKVFESEGRGRIRGLLSFGVRLAAGIGLLAFLLSRIDRKSLGHLLVRERPSFFVAALLLYVAGQAGCAWRWQMLARIGGIDRKLSDFLKFYFIGIFTNLFVPGLIGGDFARTIYLARTREFLSRAAASVAADRVVGLLALVWFAAATAAGLGIGRLPTAATTPLISLGAISLAGFAASPLMFRAVRAMPDRLSSIGRLLEPYFEKRAALLPLILFSVAMHALQVGCQYILARGIGLKIPFSVFLICVPVTNALATLPITLNGLGVREGLYVLLFSAMGVSRPDAVAMGILWFGCSAAGGLFGAPAFVTSKPPVLTRKG